MAHPIDEAIGDLALGDTGGFGLRFLHVIRVNQLAQGMSHQLLKGPAEGVLPDGVKGDRQHVQLGNGQQVP